MQSAYMEECQSKVRGMTKKQVTTIFFLVKSTSYTFRPYPVRALIVLSLQQTRDIVSSSFYDEMISMLLLGHLFTFIV